MNVLEYIRGISDTQRNDIIAYSREHLSFIPYYEHPMYPGKPDFSTTIGYKKYIYF
jgi:hypothetical protein